jgi:hypothetical protein
VLSNLRLGIRLPISGHSLVVSYLLFRRLFVQQITDISRIEIMSAIFVLAILSYIKLFWWTDPITLSLGVILALSFVIIGRAITKSASIKNPSISI